MKTMHPLTEKSTDEVARVAFRFRDDNSLVAIHGEYRERVMYDIDVRHLTLFRHLPTTSEPLTSRDAFSLIYQTYLYVLRLTDTRTIRRNTTVDRDVVTKARDNVFMSPDILSFKIATLRCVTQKLTPDDTNSVERHFEACGLRSADAILFYMLYLNNDIQDFIQSLKLIEDKQFRLSINSIPEELDGKACIEFNKAAKYNAWGIRFIAKANRFEHTDLVQDLLMRCVQAYYWVRPFYSKAHAINYAKRATYRHAQNMREYWQSEDRARLKTLPDGSHYNVISTLSDAVLEMGLHDEEDKVIELIDYKRDWL